MADAAAGEPLALRHGVALFSAQTTYGTAVAPATSLGAALVGHTRGTENLDVRGAGSANRLAVKGGTIRTPFRIRWAMAQTGIKAFLQKAFRSGGVLPLVTLGFGYQDDTPTTPVRASDQIQDAKIGSLRLSLDASGQSLRPLEAEVAGEGGLITELTTLVPATLSTTPWDTSEAVVTRAAGAYQLRSFTLEVEQVLTRDHVVPGAAPASYKRGHKYLTEHAEMIRGTISRYAKSGINAHADTISTAAMVVVLTNRVDSVLLTLTFAGVDFGDEEQVIDEDGIRYDFPFSATTLVVT